MPDLENFRSLGLSEQTIAALVAKGFEEPTPIQARVIPLLISGEKDMIGQAQTGTGKTAAFGLPVIELLEGGSKQPKALILSPTRELCLQIAAEMDTLKGAKRLKMLAVYGGSAIDPQIHSLKNGVDVVIGTPGRVIDLIDRGYLKLNALDFAILDEADEMLNMGFVEDIEQILENTPSEKRMLMFSATMPAPIRKIAERFMRTDYEIVHVEMNRLAVDLTDQGYFEVRRENKLEALSRLIDVTDDMYAMVFCRTRSDVDDLREALMYRGYPVEALHGDIAQAQRTKVINRFKEGKFKILIATDVAARGIDVNGLSHVINFSIPTSPEAYVHRIGRTGRAGKQGRAITFVTPGETRTLQRIMREAKADIKREAIPLPTEVLEAKLRRVSTMISCMIDKNAHNDYLSFAHELLASNDDAASVVSSLLKLKFKDELLENSFGDINILRDAKGARREKKGFGEKSVRLFFGAGHVDRVGPGEILDLIYDVSHVRKSNIGRIDIFDNYSFIDVAASSADTLISSFRRSGIKVSTATDPAGSGDGAERDSDRTAHQRQFSPRDRKNAPVRKSLTHRNEGRRDFRDRDNRDNRDSRDNRDNRDGRSSYGDRKKRSDQDFGSKKKYRRP